MKFLEPVDEARPPRVRPLSLRRFSGTECQARSTIARRLRGLDLALGGHDWRFSCTPLLHPPSSCARSDLWRIDAHWGGAAFEVQLSAAAAQAWIEGSFPALDLPALPPAFVPAVLEAACDAARAPAAGGGVRIDRLEPAGDAGLTLPHQLALEARRHGAAVHATLATDSLGLMVLAGALARFEDRANALHLDAVPVALRAEIGFTWLPVADFASLRVGDAVLVEHAHIMADGELWLAHGDWGLRAYWNDTSLTVTTELTRGGWTMPIDDAAPDAGERPLGELAALPLRLAFDLGERTISLGELRALQVGESIDLGRPLASAVQLRVNGVLVGSGELIDIDGRLGVAISQLHVAAARVSASAAHAAAASASASAVGPPDRHHEELDEAAWSELDDE